MATSEDWHFWASSGVSGLTCSLDLKTTSWPSLGYHYYSPTVVAENLIFHICYHLPLKKQYYELQHIQCMQFTMFVLFHQINFLHLTVSEIQPGQTFSRCPPNHPPTHPDTTKLKGCGVKMVSTMYCMDFPSTKVDILLEISHVFNIMESFLCLL